MSPAVLQGLFPFYHYGPLFALIRWQAKSFRRYFIAADKLPGKMVIESRDDRLYRGHHVQPKNFTRALMPSSKNGMQMSDNQSSSIL